MRPSGGTLSKDDIQRVIAKHLHEIQFCYEKALRTQPSLAGRVALEWTINLSGRVTKVRTADSTLASDAAVNCMTAAVKTWTFPEPRGGEVTVAFPFIFNAL